MLNIPESVKTLYKADGIRKNFRCHFPNGELPDITNADIVQESVQFQESVCSQDVFKFGTSEASVIEFETVGVANMYGMKIECSSEIDCSSLTAAQIVEIEAGTWDGEYVPLADSDTGFPFFRVPYGVFTVDSCPRDHQTMTHRRVTGYSEALRLYRISEFEEFKMKASFPNNKTFKADIKKIVYSSPKLSFPYEEKTLIHSFDGEGTYSQPQQMTVRERATGETKTLYLYSGVDGYIIDETDNLFCIEMKNYSEDFALDAIENIKTLYDDGRGGKSLDSFSSGFLKPQLSLRVPSENISPVFFIDNDLPVFWPYRGINGASCTVRICKRLKVEVSTTYGRKEIVSVASSNAPELYKYSLETSIPIYLNISSTLADNGKYSYINSFSQKDLLEAYGELTAAFSTYSKTSGKLQLKHLDNIDAIEIDGNDYSQMWFDEYNVEPIDTVRYAYTDESGEEQVVDYKFGDGASVYDMTDNYVLKNMDGASPEIIESILDTMFIPYLSPINFTPVDLSMKGLPYIEAGDALSVTAQDGTVCSTYALRRELDGVQVLTDQIDSESGLIIDSEETE